MKLIVTSFAATALLALAACNQPSAADNNTAAANAVDANATAPAANSADANAAKPADAGTPAGGEAAPAGDKPTEYAQRDDIRGRPRGRSLPRCLA